MASTARTALRSMKELAAELEEAYAAISERREAIRMRSSLQEYEALSDKITSCVYVLRALRPAIKVVEELLT